MRKWAFIDEFDSDDLTILLYINWDKDQFDLHDHIEFVKSEQVKFKNKNNVIGRFTKITWYLPNKQLYLYQFWNKGSLAPTAPGWINEDYGAGLKLIDITAAEIKDKKIINKVRYCIDVDQLPKLDEKYELIFDKEDLPHAWYAVALKQQ